MASKDGNNNVKKDKEAAIFDAACQVIREYGFHQARMADIAKKAGISYGLVYHYFKSKADLFDVVMEEWWKGMDGVIESAMDPDVPVVRKLEAIAAYHLDTYQERPDLAHVFITEYARSSAMLTPERLMRFKNFIFGVEEIMAQAQEKGELRTDLKPRYLATIFLGGIETLITNMVLVDQPLKSSRLKNRLKYAVMTMFFEGAHPTAGST